jgi:hypothetical protein
MAKAMFSWSFKWLWAQCLVVAAGLFLLGAMRVPSEGSLTQISGTVDHVGLRARKGLGSFYTLALHDADGAPAEILIDRGALNETAVRRLIGKHVTAKVNWSSEAISLEDAPADIAEQVSASAKAAGRQYTLLGLAAMLIGLGFGAATLLFGFGRTED